MAFFGHYQPEWPQLFADRRNALCDRRMEYVAQQRLPRSLSKWRCL